MKKTVIALCIIAALLVFAQHVFAGGGKQAATLTIGATPVPHAELLELIKDDLAADGINLKVVIYNDYVQPNEALVAGDLDANYFQHLPYLEGTNDTWKEKLVSAFGVHIEPMGLYSQKTKSVADLKNGAVIAIPNDPTNEGRALLLLQAKGLLKLSDSAGLSATPADIVQNPKNLKFQELESAQLPRVVADVDAAVINSNYAMDAGFVPARDALIIEASESPYVNIVVVRKGMEADSKILALKKALCSPKIRDYINKTWNGSVVATF